MVSIVVVSVIVSFFVFGGEVLICLWYALSINVLTMIIYVLIYLIHFYNLKNRAKHPWMKVTFSKVVGF